MKKNMTQRVLTHSECSMIKYGDGLEQNVQALKTVYVTAQNTAMTGNQWRLGTFGVLFT